MKNHVRVLSVLCIAYLVATIAAIAATKWGVTRMYPEAMRSTVGWSSSVATILAAQLNVIVILFIWGKLKSK
jgi:hypothetical protein